MTERSGWIDEAARRVFALNGRPDLRGLPELFLDPCPRSIYVSPDDVGAAQGSELHAVGIYQADPTNPDSDESKVPDVHIAVRHTPHPIVLFLMSYHRVVWNINVEEGAELAGVCLSSYEPSTVRCTAELAFVAPVPEGPHEHTFEARDSDDLGADRLLARLRALTRLSLTSFQGEYYGDRFTVPFYDDVTPIRQVLARHRELLAERTTAPTATFLWVANGFITRHGTRDQPVPVPEGAKAVAFCAADERFYVNTRHDLYAINSSGECEKIVAPSGPFSWLGGVAYDSKRRRIVITSFWHAGVHYLYDPVGKTWATVDIERTGGGVHAIVYDPGRDVMVAVGLAPLDCRLIVLHPDLDQVRVVATTNTLPLPNGPTSNVKIQMAALPDAVLVCCGEDDWVDAMARGETPPPEQAFLVRLDRDEQLRVDLDATPRFDPVSRDFTSGLGVDGYEGSITLADLRRDARTIVEQVHRTEVPLLVNHPRGQHAMIIGYYLYHGQLASLDETTYPDWQERLARATREIAEGKIVPHAAVVGSTSAPHVFWTEQAADDYRAVDRSYRFGLGLMLRDGLVLAGLPMDGPFHGWGARPFAGVRLIYQQCGKAIFVGYLRKEPRHTWGRLIGVRAEKPSGV